MQSIDRAPESSPTPVFLVSSPMSDEEISLVGLGKVIKRRKGILVSGLLLCLLPAILYLVSANPVYRASIHLLPPQQATIQALVVDSDNQSGQMYTPETVYAAFLENLNSSGMRREFFSRNRVFDHYLSDDQGENANIDRVFSERFDSNIQVDIDTNAPSFVTVNLSDNDPNFAAQLLNQLIEFINKRTVNQLVDNVNAVVKSQITTIQAEIAKKRLTAEAVTRDEIVRLQEARSIAAALGIQDTSSHPALSNTAQARLTVTTTQLPLYMRGVEALDREIEALKSRESVDPFITGLRQLQERLALLEADSINVDSLSAVTVSDAARPPYRRSSPRYAQVVLLAVMAGVMLGVLMAFIMEIAAGFKASR